MPVRLEIRFQATSGEALRGFLVLPDQVRGRHPGVLLIHEIWGMHAAVLDVAERFAREGYVAFVPDLFDRRAGKAICVAKAMTALATSEGTMVDDLVGAREALASRPEVDPARLAVAGFCMGGGFTLLLAARGGFRAAAPFYGQVPRRAEQLRGICPVVASFGGRDPIFARQAPVLRKHLGALRVENDVKVYPDAGHSFMNRVQEGVYEALVEGLPPLHAAYDPVAAEDAWTRMLAFFERHLGPPVHA